MGNTKFIDEFGLGFQVFTVPVQDRQKRYLLDLLVNRDISELSIRELDSQYSHYVEFLDEGDALTVYCDRNRYVIFTIDAEHFGIIAESTGECLACGTSPTDIFTYRGTNIRMKSSRQGIEAKLCLSCIDEFNSELEEGSFATSVVSNQI